MKKIYWFILLLIPLQIFGQDYKLITSTSKKLFTDYPEPFNTYSISFESTKVIDGDSIYYNYFNLSNNNFESDTCYFWGGPYCDQQNAPSWIGTDVTYNNVDSYVFYNLNHDSLHFSFNTNTGDTNIFYEDSIQKFLITYENTDTLNVLENLDSARYYKVIHTDIDGNTINSQLNGQNIIISKDIGLVQFFVVDSFPSVLKPVYLIGNASPTAGFYQLTNDMVYDYQPGDEIQYKERSYYSNPNNPPWYFYERYRKHTFLDRQETNDSLIYKIYQELFYVDSADVFNDTIVKKYLKSEVISQIPFEKFDGRTRNLKLVDYCDTKKWTYSFIHYQNAEYCEADTCWGTADVFGPPEVHTYKAVCGLGVYYNKYTVSGFDGYTIYSSVVYYKKGENICGDEVVGIVDNYVLVNNVDIRPNPASSIISVSSPVEIDKLIISDLSGRLLLQKSVLSNEVTVDISSLKSGLYLVNMLFDDGLRVTKKIVVHK